MSRLLNGEGGMMGAGAATARGQYPVGWAEPCQPHLALAFLDV